MTEKQHSGIKRISMNSQTSFEKKNEDTR